MVAMDVDVSSMNHFNSQFSEDRDAGKDEFYQHSAGPLGNVVTADEVTELVCSLVYFLPNRKP